MGAQAKVDKPLKNNFKEFVFFAAVMMVVGTKAQIPHVLYSDLRWAELHGPVSYVEEFTPEPFDRYSEEKTYNFSRHGELFYLAINGRPQTIRRDSVGRISFVYTDYPCWGCGDGSTIDVGMEYFYDEVELPVRSYEVLYECGDSIGTVFDERGWRFRAKGQAMGDCDESERKYVYLYDDIDAYGNWQTRHAKILITDNYSDAVSLRTITTTRRIYYYDE